MKRIIYIMGAGRSGTTLLSRMLGSLSGLINAGEALKYLHNHDFQNRNIPCGCGKTIAECEYWRNVFKNLNLENISEKNRILQAGSFFKLLPGIDKNKKTVMDIAGDYKFFLSIFSNDDSIIVDASKSPSIALILRKQSDYPVTILHLIRNPIDVIASWGEPNEYLKKKSFTTAYLTWLSRNTRAIILKVFYPTVVIDFQDLLKNPRNIFKKIGLETKVNEIFIDQDNIRLTEQHSIAGNPAKLSSGSTRLKQNRKELNRLYKFFVYLTLYPIYFIIISLFKNDRITNQQLFNRDK